MEESNRDSQAWFNRVHRLVPITDYLVDQGRVAVDSGIDDQGRGLRAVDLRKFKMPSFDFDFPIRCHASQRYSVA